MLRYSFKGKTISNISADIFQKFSFKTKKSMLTETSLSKEVVIVVNL